jgi:hypothetical protein
LRAPNPNPNPRCSLGRGISESMRERHPLWGDLGFFFLLPFFGYNVPSHVLELGTLHLPNIIFFS